MLNFSRSYFLFLLSCIQLFTVSFLEANETSNELQVAIFGFGGRVQDVLAECVQLKQETGKTMRLSLYVTIMPKSLMIFTLKIDFLQSWQLIMRKFLGQRAFTRYRRRYSSSFG